MSGEPLTRHDRARILKDMRRAFRKEKSPWTPRNVRRFFRGHPGA